MFRYKRIYHDEHIDRFEYYPEGNTDDPGIIEYVDGELSQIIPAKCDPVGCYFEQAWNIDRTKESGIVAWC